MRYAPQFYLGVAYHALGDCEAALRQFAESDARKETARDAELSLPRLIVPAVQVNIRGGRMPPPESNGTSYLKVPVDTL